MLILSMGTSYQLWSSTGNIIGKRMVITRSHFSTLYIIMARAKQHL